ncbi:MAG: hypothetical protein KKB81_02280 [Candidatus Margulisbacteria bacterium]|nr:hypothetical protein [Candidatus Margulisiibacteriota bacterium]MBU1022610.1 hypothetical protein [Candidatus Margulisiibacteriota bacterium]MBU1728896.1 hypothetical protein [Candidatus Margulisiibacteriota bacterium]MBU1955528.1 hypothetical protein [Candidatus Margulisiibacteriota bacterium]
MKDKIIVFIILGIILLPLVGWAESRTSTSYKLSIDSMGVAIEEQTSTSYKLLAEVKERELTSQSKAGYILNQGFKPAAFMLASAGPIIISITPNNGYNIAPADATITGLHFDTGATVSLVGTTETITGDISSITSTQIVADFNITGMPVGFYDVVVTNPDGLSYSLTNGFEVKAYDYPTDLIFCYPSPFDPRTGSTRVVFNVPNDMLVKVYIFNVVAELIWVREINATTGMNSFDWDGTTRFGRINTSSAFIIHVIDKSNGKTVAKGKVGTLIRP